MATISLNMSLRVSMQCLTMNSYSMKFHSLQLLPAPQGSWTETVQLKNTTVHKVFTLDLKPQRVRGTFFWYLYRGCKCFVVTLHKLIFFLRGWAGLG